MPEGHTLHRLALDLTQAFGGRVVSVSSPQGRFAESAAQLDKIARYVEAGLTKFVLWPACPPSDLIAQVDRFAHEIVPQFGG